MDAAGQWAELVAPWRAQAEEAGFRFLDRDVDLIEGGHRCVDYLVSGATWLDLYGELGQTHGMWSATFTTWIDAGEGRFSLTTIGEKMPRPRPRNVFGWMAAELVAPLMRRMAPPDRRPIPMRDPADLRRVLEKHTGEILAIGGKPILFKDLQERFAQARRDEAAE